MSQSLLTKLPNPVCAAHAKLCTAAALLLPMPAQRNSIIERRIRHGSTSSIEFLTDAIACLLLRRRRAGLQPSQLDLKAVIRSQQVDDRTWPTPEVRQMHQPPLIASIG